MFPGADLHGIDLVLPDFTYLRDNAGAHRSAASRPTATRTTSAACSSCCASVSLPIYGSALTLGLARNRIEEAGLLGRTELQSPSRDGERAAIGPFDVEFIPVTHSVPHAHRPSPCTRRRA